MSMNLLPENCLYHIFTSLHDVHTLFKCLRVCKKWNHLVSYRLAKAERLLDEWIVRVAQLDDKSLLYNVKIKPLVKQILAKILEKTPELKMVSIGYEIEQHRYKNLEWIRKSINLLCELKSLQGLMISGWQERESMSIPRSITSLYCKDFRITDGHYPRVRHLIVEDDFFNDCIERFPNIEWLTLRINQDDDEWLEKARCNQPVFKNLKILEIDTTWNLHEYADENFAIQFINFCPQLESAHLKIALDQKLPDDNFKHENLTNLVITFVDFHRIEKYRHNLLNIVKRFPNIKHLAIKSYKNDTHRKYESDECDSGYDSGYEGYDEDEKWRDEHDEAYSNIYAVLRVLPKEIAFYLKKLVLLDMRGITGIDIFSAKSVQRQFKKNNQLSAKFYYHNTKDDEIKRDWPRLFVKHRDSSAFKFMAKHFLPEYPKTRLVQTDV